VEIDLGAGLLTVRGGSGGLATTKFTYNVDGWKPTVDYKLEGTRGTLTVSQPRGPMVIATNTRNEWDVALSQAIPIDLRVNTGAGKSDLMLGGLSLTSVNIAGGAGELRADLSGDWSRSANVDISGGVGKISVLLPSAGGCGRRPRPVSAASPPPASPEPAPPGRMRNTADRR
jgi:hypothetical protein